MVIGTLEQQPIGKRHVVGHDFVLRGLLAIAEPWIDYHFELRARRLQKLKLAQHPKLGHVGNIVTDGLGQTSPVQKHDQPWHPPQTEEPQFELTRRVGGRRQRGRNGHKAANQMLTKHLTGYLQIIQIATKSQVELDESPAPLFTSN